MSDPKIAFENQLIRIVLRGDRCHIEQAQNDAMGATTWIPKQTIAVVPTYSQPVERALSFALAEPTKETKPTGKAFEEWAEEIYRTLKSGSRSAAIDHLRYSLEDAWERQPKEKRYVPRSDADRQEKETKEAAEAKALGPLYAVDELAGRIHNIRDLAEGWSNPHFQASVLAQLDLVWPAFRAVKVAVEGLVQQKPLGRGATGVAYKLAKFIETRVRELQYEKKCPHTLQSLSPGDLATDLRAILYDALLSLDAKQPSKEENAKSDEPQKAPTEETLETYIDPAISLRYKLNDLQKNMNAGTDKGLLLFKLLDTIADAEKCDSAIRELYGALIDIRHDSRRLLNVLKAHRDDVDHAVKELSRNLPALK